MEKCIGTASAKIFAELFITVERKPEIAERH